MISRKIIPATSSYTPSTNPLNISIRVAGFFIHAAVHKARPDVIAAAHTHSVHGMAWSAFGKPLEMLTQDATYLYSEALAVYKVCLLP
ncbi:CCAAT-binding transcription factor subunit B [Apiospora arundinis]|uniref:Arad-like aldolase/epimerase n=1 Tax=Apiospora arundinis TaxID=335852 RepID=A0ABR2ITT9_9PEZI